MSDQVSHDAELFEQGGRAWPGIALDRETFARYVRERSSPGDAAPLRADDLYIACACVGGDERALAEFDKRYLTQVPAFLAKSNAAPQLVDEVKQRLRERLFVEGKIAQYTGRGSLVSWLRVVTLRLTSNLRRGSRTEGTSAGLDETLPSAAIDPELDIIRRRYGQEFKGALHAAIGQLAAEERTLLRLHYLDGLNIERIAVVFHVSRATIGRRLIAVRETIVENTHLLLRERLGASSEELASLLRVVRSDLAMSLSVVLRDG